METEVIKISARNLVEFILRTGDIDNRKVTADKDAMLLGGKIHRKIQRMMGADYQAEVPLKMEIPCKGFALKLEGRADGIIEKRSGEVSSYTIDEIKGVFRDVNLMKEAEAVHLAQAKCYAYMWLKKQNALPETLISVQMTYCNLETEEIRYFVSEHRYEELEQWFGDLVKAYEPWGQFQVQWKQERTASIKQVEFPFEYREGQRDLVAGVYRTILRKKKLFIQAPTGVGKTMANVFPAVKAVGEGLGEKIFYLTARTTTRAAAMQAFEILKEQNLQMKVEILTAKEKICSQEEMVCNPEHCSCAEGHFDRVNEAVYDLLTSGNEFSREKIFEYAVKHNVCPYEMSLDLSLWVDAIVCDYNYVFDPNAHLRRFFGEGNKGEYLFLIDEAHNLVERGREMYSAHLCKEDFLKIRRMVKQRDKKLGDALNGANKILLELKRECESYQVLEGTGSLYLKLLHVMAELERYQDEARHRVVEEETQKEILDFYFMIRSFIDIYERVDENYVIYSELKSDGSFWLHLMCVNPAANLAEYLNKGNSAIFFSATLLPVNYYKKLLTTDTESYAIYARSPFDPSNRQILIGRDVSTRYTRRGPDMYLQYANYLKAAVEAKKGNYLAFFPSYRFMEEVYDCFLSVAGDTADVLIQSQSMSEAAREEFLQEFSLERENALLGFCVMGGIFSEGIDLTEDRLIGSIIVGTGIPQVCLERELLKNYFDSHGGQGFDYAYLYPGMNKVLQSAGRVIRTETDQGVILLLDDRFQDRRYQEIFPREWEMVESCKTGDVSKKIIKFWKESAQKH